MSMSIWWFVLVIVVAVGLGVVWGYALCAERSRPDLTELEPDE